MPHCAGLHPPAAWPGASASVRAPQSAPSTVVSSRSPVVRETGDVTLYSNRTLKQLLFPPTQPVQLLYLPALEAAPFPRDAPYPMQGSSRPERAALRQSVSEAGDAEEAFPFDKTYCTSEQSARRPHRGRPARIPLFGLRVEWQGVDGGRMSAAVEFHGQRCTRFTEIPQRKAECDHGVQLWRERRTADPAHFTISAEEF